jgi:hypothetical protein
MSDETTEILKEILQEIREVKGYVIPKNKPSNSKLNEVNKPNVIKVNNSKKETLANLKSKELLNEKVKKATRNQKSRQREQSRSPENKKKESEKTRNTRKLKKYFYNSNSRIFTNKKTGTRYPEIIKWKKPFPNIANPILGTQNSPKIKKLPNEEGFIYSTRIDKFIRWKDRHVFHTKLNNNNFKPIPDLSETVGKIKKGVEYEDVNPEDIIAINTPNENEENEENEEKK